METSNTKMTDIGLTCQIMYQYLKGKGSSKYFCQLFQTKIINLQIFREPFTNYFQTPIVLKDKGSRSLFVFLSFFDKSGQYPFSLFIFCMKNVTRKYSHRAMQNLAIVGCLIKSLVAMELAAT